jgi:hypothetical protein
MCFVGAEDGHLREFPISKDGSFKGELVTGQYAYYLAKRVAPGAIQQQPKLASKYFEADMSRTVSVQPDQLLEIVLN